MAYETGTPSSIQDLVQKLFTFLTTIPTTVWTQDQLDTTNKWATIHLGSCYVSFRWDATAQTDLAVYQSLGYTSGAPHLIATDSGNGDTTVPIDSTRRVNFTAAGPFTKYYFFASDAAPYYCHVVVEVSSGRFRHFGFGNLDKIGTWTGGEYAYGHFWSQTTVQIDNPAINGHTMLLDGALGTANLAATVHLEGVGSMGVNDKWGVCGSGLTPATDRAGNARCALAGGGRAGFWGYVMGWMTTARINAFKPLIPIPLIYVDTSTAPDTWILLGHQPDVMMLNMKHYNAADEVTVGSDTWVVFPWVRKQYLQADTEESWNAGVAYKKIV